MTRSAHWYVINVYSGFEKKVVQAIQEQAEKKGMSDRFEEMLVPSEEVVEIHKGAKVNTEKQYFPGYVLVKMELTDETWHLVKNTPRVSGFLGAKGKPSPISEVEVSRILRQVQDSIEKPRHTLSFEIGEQVRVCEGPFTSFSGLVEDVDGEKGRLKVSVMIFGRPTPVELEFGQVEKQQG
ncbi:MAG: transcription termination/antitermination protein NusG [Alphaproteobacteria bacterium]|nr:transcription termination/antitermination protein NusG [Alphaproteobacteria bacterium]